MKKLFLLLAAGVVAYGSNAQVPGSSWIKQADKAPVTEKLQLSEEFINARAAAKTSPKFKTTGANERWYIPFDMIDLILTGGNLNLSNNLRACPIFFDSTVLQNFTSGPGQINYSSISQVIDPISNDTLFDDPAAFPGEMALTPFEPYIVDSVMIDAVYERKENKPNVVDTLIISLAPNRITYYWRGSQLSPNWAAPYLPSGKDTLWGIAPTKTDSVNRAIFSDADGTGGNPNVPRIMWKVPLDANDGDTALLIKRYTYPVPNGGMLVPAGYRVAVAFTFKSGDTWTPNVDFFDDLNNFRGIFSQNTVGGQMPYFYYSAKDRNGSALMFSTDTSWYLPSVVIEAVNQPTFSYEFLSAGIHARDTAIIDNVNDIAKAINVKAYPNPAKGSVSIDYQLETANAVTISITNTVGQVLKVKTLDKAVSGRTSFDVSDLASGVYFYTIEADGRRVTHRLAVTN